MTGSTASPQVEAAVWKCIDSYGSVRLVRALDDVCKLVLHDTMAAHRASLRIRNNVRVFGKPCLIEELEKLTGCEVGRAAA